MQSTILFVTLALMALVATVTLTAMLAAYGPASADNINKTRSKLLWGLVLLGVAVSVASLREWPHRSSGGDAVVANITSGQWWWEIDTAEIPLGREVEFRVTSEDVTHGLGIFDPNRVLVAQVQAMPGYTNRLVHTFAAPGTYEILCMEYCGIGHHEMSNTFEVLELN